MVLNQFGAMSSEDYNKAYDYLQYKKEVNEMSIKELNEYCIKKNKCIKVNSGKLCGFISELGR